MKQLTIVLIAVFTLQTAFAQREEKPEEKGGFKKENLFTGGSLTVSFFNGQTVLGASPIFGYKIADFLDAGILFGYQYAGARDVQYYNDKVKQTTIGPGAFMRIYPVNILFLQGQFEQNFIKQKYIYPGGSPVETDHISVSSFLVGGGLAQGRERGGTTFYYISVLFDVLKDRNSPYTRVTFNPDNPSDYRVDVVPIIKAGINIGLFQGK